MNIFNDFEDLVGEPNIKHLHNTLNDFFELAGTIKSLLGKQAYLLDKYIYDILNAVNTVPSHVVASDGFEASGELRVLISGIMDSEESVKKHLLYEKAKEYIESHPLPYQEKSTVHDIYFLALIDDFLEYITPIFIAKRKNTIRAQIDIVESRHLFIKISEIIGGEEKMEQLNQLIHQRFILVSDMNSFLQGLTDNLLYALTHRDMETGKTVLQLWNEK